MVLNAAAKPAQLILAERRDGAVQLPGADRGGRIRHFPYRSQDGSQELPRRQQREHRGDGDAGAETDERPLSRLAGRPARVFHILLVDLQDFRGSHLNSAELVEQARRAHGSVISAGLVGGVGEEVIALPTVVSCKRGQPVGQLGLARQGNVGLLDPQLLVEVRPVVAVLLAGVVFPAREGELKRRVNPLDRFVQTEHGPDAVVVFPQDQVHAAAELLEQNDAGPAQGGNERQERTES